MAEFLLNPEELRDLTGRTRRNSQVESLNYMGIEHRVRPDGRVIVLRAHAERVLGGHADGKKERQRKNFEPDWSAI